MNNISFQLNGDAKSVAPGTTIAELIVELGLENRRIAVEINLEVLSKTAFKDHELAEGDKVEIVSFVGGG